MTSDGVDAEAVDLLVKRLGERRFKDLQEQMGAIAHRFKKRAERHAERAIMPLTPTTADLKALDEEVELLHEKNVLKLDDWSEEDPYAGMGAVKRFFKKYLMLPPAIHPQSNHRTFFLGVQTFVMLYNAWVIPLRFAFGTTYQPDTSDLTWAALDYLSDGIYIFDMLVIKTRIMFLNDSGIFERDRSLIVRNYVKKGTFRRDLLSLLPLDLFYLVLGFNGRSAFLRLPRLLRFYHMNIFFDRLDASLPYPVIIRLVRTINTMLFLIHIFTCLYFLYSDLEGLDSSSFVYNGYGHAYIRCFYVAMKTQIRDCSCGINPKPLKDSPSQMLFMGIMWLCGIFFFAILMGNVKDIIDSSKAAQDEYLNRFDQIRGYMVAMNVPNETMDRVKLWCQYTWKTMRSFDEQSILAHLPEKMRLDMALNVHYKTIKNAKLFHGCDPGLIKEIVGRLKPIIYLPGDYICQKGDVGKEMFIITTGQVQVVGGPDDSIVFVTLGVGVCFGEIALLGTGGMNRRTANVRAHGFTTLYVLYKEDLNIALTEFPEDRELLGRKAKKAAKEVAAKQNADKPKVAAGKEDIVIPNWRDPKILRTTMKLLPAKVRNRLDNGWTSSAMKYSVNDGAEKVDEEMKNADEILVVESEIVEVDDATND